MEQSFTHLNGYAVEDAKARKRNSNINVLEFGAKGDGLIDDTQAFKDAIDYVIANKLKLYIPAGTYLCSSTIDITTNDLVIIGDKGAIIDSSLCESYFLNFLECNNIKIQNIEFICKNASALNFSECTHILVDSCKITSKHNEGVNTCCLTVQRESGSLLGDCVDFKITNCEFVSSFIGVLFQGRSEKYLKNVIVDKCIFTPLATNIAGSGELLKIDYYTCNVVLSNNMFNGCYLSAITCEEASDNITIENNIINGISGTSTYGIRTYKGQQELTSKNLSILNNIIKDCATGIVNEAYDNVYIIGNTITGSTTQSLYLTNATFRVVKDNYINGAGLICRDGSLIEDNIIIVEEGQIALQLIGSNKAKISNNIIENGNVTSRNGENLLIKNNSFINTVQSSNGAIYIYSTDTVVRSNIKILDNIINGKTLNSGVYISNNQDHVYLKNNIIENSTKNMDIKDTVTNLINLDSRYYENFGSIPTSGTYHKGDVIWNKNAVVGSPIGYVCTVAGTPGTWKPFGTITE